jgi:hypothetical protein
VTRALVIVAMVIAPLALSMAACGTSEKPPVVAATKPSAAPTSASATSAAPSSETPSSPSTSASSSSATAFKLLDEGEPADIFGSSSATPPKVPEALVSTGAVAGSKAIVDADSVLARNRWRFKVCYGKALGADHSLAGTIKVSFVVGQAGEVTSATLASNTFPSALGACVRDAFHALKFPVPTTSPVTLTVAIMLATKK